ncbi:Cotton fiber expressed protein [Carex littledalei]|uniref:Cotton fiber expressed protein n=1 Tax=Carex littledalei TaxID=544730 RepID=A0A833RN76_9POAL|nr:Cotton fiber expressed protein [Carex littledalei]
MSYITQRTRVKFEDNIRFVPETSYNSTYQGPRFPNLQSLFKQNSTQNYYTTEETTQIIAPVHAEEKIAPVHAEEKTAKPNPTKTVNKEDVNTEAADFIKRRYQNLELQRLLSMKAAA